MEISKVYPNGRNKAKTPAKRYLRGTAKEGQINKKCSVSSIPSFVGHIGFIVSLKLCLNFVKIKFTKANLELSEIGKDLLGH